MRAILAASLSIVIGSTAAQGSSLSATFTSAVFFGDSLSDDGTLPLPPPYINGQFSNGPVFADILDDPFPSLNTENYAVGGAVTTGGVVPDLSQQIGQLEDDLDSSAGAPALELGSAPLASVWMGANNLFGALEAFGAGIIADDPVQIELAAQVARNAASDIGVGLQRLIDDFSISDLLVLNLPDLGLTPRVLASPGLSDGARDLTEAFNTALDQEIDDLTGAGINVTEINVFQLFDQIIAGERLTTLTDLDTPCLTGFPFASATCSTPESFLFWDEVHPTAVTHADLANVILDELAPIPVPPSLPLLALGALALGLLGRRRASGPLPRH